MRYFQKRVSTQLTSLLSIASLFCATNYLSADFATQPQAAIDSSGNQVAVWELDSSDGSSSIQASVYSSEDLTWSTPAAISGSDSGQVPLLIANSSGQTVAAWLLADPVNEVYSMATSMLVSGTWTTPTVLSGSTEQVFDDFKFNINESGQIVIIWSSIDINTNESFIMTSTASFDGSWSTPVQLF